MGLKGDIEEVIKAEWKSSPLWMKLWLCLSAYIALSSIASLAETIVKWKGFILDAINFYRQWIRFPLRELFQLLHIHIPEKKADVIIAGSLLYGCYIRVFYSTLYWTGQSLEKLFFWIFFVVFTCFMIIAFLMPPYIQWFVAFILFIWPLYHFYHYRDDHISEDRTFENLCIPFYGQILFVLLIVAFLAAINKGL